MCPERGVRSYDVRAATLGDADAVRSLLEVSYPALMAASYEEVEFAPVLPKITRPSPALLTSGTWYVAVRSDGALLGCGGWTRERPGTGEVVPGLAHVRHFAVHPDWTRCGVGWAIYHHGERAARAAGIKRMECWASLNSEPFYTALGFESVREIGVLIEKELPFRAVLMRRTL